MASHSHTPQHSAPLHDLKADGVHAAHAAATSPVIVGLMRLGFMIRGLLYGVIGILALQVAFGTGGSIDDPQGAIVTMGATPYGHLLLYVICAGLIGYALWGVVRALFDPLHKGHDAKGIVSRIGYLVSAVSYGLLAVATYGLINDSASAARNGAQTTQTQQTTASVLAHPLGQVLVGIAALVVIGVGIGQLVGALRPGFDQQFTPYALSARQRVWLERLGRFGTAARGFVFALIGLFLLLAAYHHDPSQAQGFGGVLSALLHQSFGPWLLGIVALGLIAFGIYSAAEGAWLGLG